MLASTSAPACAARMRGAHSCKSATRPDISFNRATASCGGGSVRRGSGRCSSTRQDVEHAPPGLAALEACTRGARRMAASTAAATLMAVIAHAGPLHAELSVPQQVGGALWVDRERLEKWGFNVARCSWWCTRARTARHSLPTVHAEACNACIANRTCPAARPLLVMHTRQTVRPAAAAIRGVVQHTGNAA